MESAGVGMVVSKKRIRFRIESQSPTFEAVIRVLQGTQEAVFAIGRYLEGTPLYGRLRTRVKVPCTLILTKISMGSPIDGEASVAQMTTQAYFGEEGELKALEDLGDRCVSVFAEVAEAVSSGPDQGQKKLRKTVDDPRHRLTIVRRFAQLIPDDMPLEIGTREKLYRFVPEAKQLATELAEQIEKEVVPTKGVNTITGPVVEARIIENRYFKIGQMLCLFKEEDVPLIEGLLGKVVSLTGKTVTTRGKTEVTEIHDLKRIENWEFPAIEYEKIKIHLSKSLRATVSFHDDLVWLTDNANLDVTGTGKTWEEAERDFSAQFMVAIVGYISQPNERLTSDAIELKERLRKLVPNWKEVLANVRALR
jgi:hypothetical protein